MNINFILIFLATLFLFACTEQEETNDKPLTVTITETINADEAIFKLAMVDSLLALQPVFEIPTEKEDSEIAEIKRKHPFFNLFSPNSDESGNLIKSAFVGFAMISDTAKVTEAIMQTEVFSKDVKTMWVVSTNSYVNLATLVLYKENSKQITLTNADIDRIHYEKGKGSGISGILGIADTYTLTVFLKRENRIFSIMDRSKDYLFKVELNNKQYFVSRSVLSMSKGLKINHEFSSAELEELNQAYPNLIQD